MRESTSSSVLRRGNFAWLGRNAALALVLLSAGGGLGYILQVAIAHWMGTSEFGAYAYATTWATALSLFTGLGLQTAIVRFVPLYNASGDLSRYAGVVRAGRWISLGASLAFSAIGTLVAIGLRDHLVSGFAPTVLAIWLIPALTLAEFDAAVARAQGKVGTAYTPWYVIRPIATIVVLGLLFTTGAGRNATTALIATLGVFIGTWFIQKWLVDRRLPREVKRAKPSWEVNEWLRVALPLLLVGGFQLALTQTDILIVGALGGRTDAALYTAASKTALLVGYLVLALGFVAGPLVPPLVAAGKRNELQQLVSVATKWVFRLSLLIGGGLALLSPYVLRLFGADFASARVPMIILIGGQVVNASFACVGCLLTFSGHQRDAARAYGFVAVLNLALCFVGAALFGMNGAAVATTLSIILWNLWLRRMTKRRLGIETWALGQPRWAAPKLPPVREGGL
jgi:O-antigen/teichoic acid export membrane protein